MTKRADWRRSALAWLLVGVPFLLYVAAWNGVTCSNDGSHYALLRAVVEQGSPMIDRYVAFTEMNDVSQVGGHFYSDRPPGTAVLAAPFYVLGFGLPDAVPAVPSKWDAGNPGLRGLLLAPTVAALALGLLFFRTTVRLGARPGFAFLATAALLLGSTLWKYGTVLFSHAALALLVFAAVAWVLRWDGAQRTRSWVGLGVLLGMMPTIEYQSVVVVVLVLLWLTASGRLRTREAALGLALGMGLPLLPLLLYFRVLFGGWLSTSYSVRLHEEWAREVSTTFHAAGLADGLAGLLLRNGESTGWFVRMPWLLAGLLGFGLAARQGRRDLLLPLLVVTAMVLLIASHQTWHGFTGDARYLVPYLALVLLPAPLLLTRVWERSRLLGGTLAVAFAASAVVSGLGTTSVLAHSYGTAELRLPYPYQDWQRDPARELRLAFPNARAVPAFAALYGAVAAAAVAGQAMRERRSWAGPATE